MKAKKDACPGPAFFLRNAAGESGPEEKAELVGHIAECARCQAKLKLLNSLRREFDRVDPGLEGIALSRGETRAFRKMARARSREIRKENGKRPVFGAGSLSARRFALAAGLLLVLIIGFGAVRYFTGGAADRRGAGAALRLIAPIGRIDRAPSDFSWSPVKNTDIYIFKLIDENLKTICAWDSHQPSFLLDPDVRARLVRGTRYLWTIEARNDTDDKLARAEGTFVIK